MVDLGDLGLEDGHRVADGGLFGRVGDLGGPERLGGHSGQVGASCQLSKHAFIIIINFIPS